MIRHSPRALEICKQRGWKFCFANEAAVELLDDTGKCIAWECMSAYCEAPQKVELGLVKHAIKRLAEDGDGC